MTCKGYDPKAIKIGKLVKMASATIANNDTRKAFIRSFVKIAEDDARQKGSRRERKDAK